MHGRGGVCFALGLVVMFTGRRAWPSNTVTGDGCQPEATRVRLDPGGNSLEAVITTVEGITPKAA